MCQRGVCIAKIMRSRNKGMEAENETKNAQSSLKLYSIPFAEFWQSIATVGVQKNSIPALA